MEQKAILEIEKYLQAKGNYADGVKLYSQFGEYASWKSIFQQRPGSKENLQLLYEQLKSTLEELKFQKNEGLTLLEKPSSAKPAIKITVDAAPILKSITAITDSYLITKDKEWKLLYREVSQLHSSFLMLEELGTAEAKEISRKNALRILELNKQIVAIKADISYYQTYGKPPAKPDEQSQSITLIDTDDMLAVQQRVLNLRSFVSREKTNKSKANQMELNAATIKDAVKKETAISKAKQKFVDADERLKQRQAELDYLLKFLQK